MSREIVWTTRFKKDYKLAMKRHMNMDLIDDITRVCHLRMQNGAFCGSIFSASVRFVQCLCGL